MNEKELQELFEAAQQMQQAGIPAQDINKEIRRVTGGEIAGVASLELRLGATGLTGVTTQDERLVNAASTPKMNPFNAAGRNALDVITFSGADELGGAMRAGLAMVPGGMSPGEAYREGRDNIRSGLVKAQHDQPIASALGMGIGAALTGRAGATMAPRLLGGAVNAGRGASVGQLAARGTGAGAAGGALYGGLSAEGGPGDRAGGAAVGGAVGAVGGGLLGLGGGVLGNALDRAAQFPAGRTQRIASNLLRRGVERTGSSAEDLVARRSQMGELATMADVDPVLAAQAGAAGEVAPSLTRVGGPADQMRIRTQTTSARVAESLRRLSDVPEDATLVTRAQRKQALRAVADRVYGPFSDMDGAVGGDDFDALIGNSPELQEILKKIRPNWDAGQSLTARETQQLVQMTREMQSELARRPAAGQRYVDAADALMDVVDAQLPALRPANRAFAQESARLSAYEAGLQASNARPHVLRNSFEALRGDNAAEQAFRRGILDGWESKLLRAPGTRGATGELMRARNVPGQDELRGRLRLLFPNDESFNAFVDGLGRDEQFAMTYNRIAGNSLTAIRDEAKKVFFGRDAPSITSRITGPMRRMIAMIPDELTREAAAEEVGRLLLTQGDEAAEEFLESVLRGRTLATIGQRISATPSRATAGVLGGVAAQDATRAGGLLDFDR